MVYTVYTSSPFEVTDPLSAQAGGLVPARRSVALHAFPDDLAEETRATGLTHITAVSGANS